MKFIELGEGASVEDLKVKRNIVVAEDLSKISTFISVGKNGRVITLDVEGNEVHTPESYAQKLELDRANFFAEIEKAQNSKELVADELLSKKISNALQAAAQQDKSAKGEWRFQNILREMYAFTKDTGAAVLATCITAYFS